MSDRIEALLHYLISHSYEQAKEKFPVVLNDVQDVKGTLTLILENPGKFAELTIQTPIFAFKGDPAFFPLPNTDIKNVFNVPGTFFIRGDPPSSKNQFWLTQYPPFLVGEPTGRTVLEFYTEDRITAVFKTDNDNFGGAGSGDFV